MSNLLSQLTPNLWTLQSRFANVNSGIIYSCDSVCLIDPGILPVETEILVRFVKTKQIESQVLILTHSHWDHLFGPEHFPGATVIAQENFYYAVQGEAGRQIYLQVEKLTSHYKIIRQKPYVIPQPQKTFSERMSLEIGEISAQLIHTPGHAADHISIYLPEDGTLWAGDMLGDLEIPYVNHSISDYESSLAKLGRLEISCLVPGHGSPTLDKTEINARMNADRAYLARLREQVTKAVADGLSISETISFCTDFQHPSLDECAEAHQLNIESVYLELGGDADPASVGWGQNLN